MRQCGSGRGGFAVWLDAGEGKSGAVKESVVTEFEAWNDQQRHEGQSHEWGAEVASHGFDGGLDG